MKTQFGDRHLDTKAGLAVSTSTSPGVSGSHEASHILPHHRIGWAALALLLMICSVPAWWAKLDDLLGPGRRGDVGMAAVAVGLAVSAFLSSREAIFERKDPAVLVGVALVLGTIAVAIGALFALSLLGLAIFGD